MEAERNEEDGVTLDRDEDFESQVMMAPVECTSRSLYEAQDVLIRRKSYLGRLQLFLRIGGNCWAREFPSNDTAQQQANKLRHAAHLPSSTDGVQQQMQSSSAK
ncbi:unnamed protein product [Cuscuta epithymum]|uniref:Uncharacterized protein n=1 Tax=Cuscuta epithymum TaxID=186058 RepID=A0AAV0E5D5_9ASTE|nr:unnamed protein product [Cuscuta epithymum]